MTHRPIHGRLTEQDPPRAPFDLAQCGERESVRERARVNSGRERNEAREPCANVRAHAYAQREERNPVALRVADESNLSTTRLSMFSLLRWGMGDSDFVVTGDVADPFD